MQSQIKIMKLSEAPYLCILFPCVCLCVHMWGRERHTGMCTYVSVCVLVHMYGSAHMCNRCVISAPRPHHCCQHVRSSACVTEDCFSCSWNRLPPLHRNPPLIFIFIHCGNLKHCSETAVGVFIRECASDCPSGAFSELGKIIPAYIFFMPQSK